MRLDGAFIPAGLAWSSPFARWQGPLAGTSSLEVGAAVTRHALNERGVAIDEITDVVLGTTVPQKGAFYGASTLAGEVGAGHASGPIIAQACATSAACVAHAAARAIDDPNREILIVTTDRTSNGPHIVYPAPGGPGGAPVTEDWVLDNFAGDPWAGEAMIATAEHVAREEGISRAELDDAVLLRYEQYRSALEDERAFQRRYMVPVQLPPARRGAESQVVDADVGVQATTRESLAALRPVTDRGVVTFGGQTHPADGAAGAIVTGEARARSHSQDGIVRLLAYGTARVEKARMPRAPVPAAEAALRSLEMGFGDLDAVTTHNPFAVNDVFFSRRTGIPLDAVNVNGSSLIFGHPQGPTGLRLLAELIETLRLRGGGVGLFAGCAAGDTGAALVIRVED